MGDRVDLVVDVEHLDDTSVVRVQGDLDMAGAEVFEDAISSAGSSAHIVVDLSACTFLDSAGMRVLTATVHDTPRVSVVATDPGILRVLQITAVDTMVSVHPTLDAAL